MTHAEQFNLENRSELLQSKNLFSAQIYADLIGKFLPVSPLMHGMSTKNDYGTKNDYLGKFDQILRHAVSLPVWFLFTVKMTLKLSDK